MIRRPRSSTLFPSPTLFRSVAVVVAESAYRVADALELAQVGYEPLPALATVEAALASTTRVHDGWPDKDRKSTRLNSSHLVISYAVFCLTKKKQNIIIYDRV